MSIDDVTPEEWSKVARDSITSRLGTGFDKDKPLTLKKDDVNHPVHYNNGKVECIEAIEAASTKEEYEGYLRGNVIKYVWRYKYKDKIKDLKKAQWYLQKLIQEIGKNIND